MSEFPFEEGETVLVRARENGTSGNIEAKFTAECEDISSGVSEVTSPIARLALPFGPRNTVTIRPYEAEFEVVDDE